MKVKALLLAAFLLLGVGFATVTTTLYMDGDVKIATNDADFDVKITKATLDGSAATISEDGKTVTFRTSSLSTVGNKTTLDFKVENNSEMYDAEVSLVCTAGEEKKDYFQMSSTTTPIAGKTTGQGQVAIELIKEKTPVTEDMFVCTLNATAKERDTKAEKPKYTPKYFAYGYPSTASTQDYTTLGKNVFVGLDADGVQKSVCTLATGSIECFKNGVDNVTEEQKHLKEVFGEANCSGGSSVSCSLGMFRCTVESGGYVSCYFDSMYCVVYSYGPVTCN